MRQQFKMLIPLEYTISNNRASPIWLRKKVKDGIAALTREHAADLYPCKTATIWVGITKRTAGIYDPTNLADTMKPMVDALVQLGTLDADDYRHVSGPWCYHQGIDKRIPPRHLHATITLTDHTVGTPF